MRARLTAICIAVLVLVPAAGCGGPTRPSGGEVTLTSVRYVRTRPVVAPEATVSLYYSIPIPDDPYQRASMGAVNLRATDEVTFVYDYPDTFSVPADQRCSFWISDEAVSPYFVATDIYVNGTAVSVERAGNYEYGRFRVDEAGRVY